MGKRPKRRTQGSQHSSKSSTNSKMNIISAQKFNNRKKKYRRKTLNSVLKIINTIKDDNISRNSSMCSFNSQNNTVIDLDATENTPVNCNLNTNHNNLVVICDDDGTKQLENVHSNVKSPIYCSTPKHKSEVRLKQSNDQLNNNSTSRNNNKEIINLTNESNEESFFTIDLTDDSLQQTSGTVNNTVIDIVNNTEGNELVPISDTSLSMSGDSDVTVLNVRKANRSQYLKKFVRGLSKLDSQEKDDLLEVITQTIFNGCNLNTNKNGVGVTPSCSYIKEVILNQTNSRNSIGSNIYNPTRMFKNNTGLRMIIIDGSNVAMQHTLGRVFSVKGLKICIDYFLNLGHNVKAFVPHFRCKYGKSTEPRLLDNLQRQGLVIYTPSREIQGRMINSYDDRYIVQCAAEFDGVIVTTDNYRDLLRENPRWRFVIENRLLPFTWVGDMLMLPQDPLGKNGPRLRDFLRH